MRSAWLAAGTGLLVAATALTAQADVIHLKSGGTIQIDAWRDVGDAVEFTRGGGIIRISKAEISRVEGSNQTHDLRMHSAPASASAATAASNAPAAAREMSQVLKEGEALFTQTVLEARAKVSAFRRLTEKWRALTVPSDLQELHGRATRALQMSTEAFEAEAEGTAPDVKEQIESAKKAFAEVQAEVDRQSKEG